MLRVKMALIDLDGTLVDSVPDLATSADAMLSQLDLAQRGEDKVRQWVGNGVERLVKRALLDSLDGEPDAQLFAEALPLFMQAYKNNNGKLSRLYPGVLEGLAFLHRCGIRLGCVTNKPKAFTEPLLQQLKIIDDFELILSGDSLPKRKPDPLPLLHAAEVFELAPAQALMVGDSVNDVKAARKAGFKAVCVSYGYNHGQDIRQAQPDVVVDSLAELDRHISALSP